jgi:hypothetical protein
MGRGNPTSAEARAARRDKVKGAVKEDALGVVKDYAEGVGVSRWTLYRDLEAIGVVKNTTPLTREEQITLRRAQYEVLLKLELATTAGTIPPDVANALVAIRREISKLWGLDEGTKSTRLNLNVDVSADPRSLDFYDRVMRLASRLGADQVEEWFRFGENMPHIIIDVTPPPMLPAPCEAPTEVEE